MGKVVSLNEFGIKSFTFFVVPFYYENDDWNTIHEEKLDKWVPLEKSLYNKEDVLYPYIMDLFKQGDQTNKTHLDIYQFNSKDLGPSSQLFVDRILGKKSVAVIAKNSGAQKNPKCISFTLKNTDNFSPHIFISSSAKIGILTFAVELESDSTIDDLKFLNYYLQKRDETGKYQCVCLRPDKQEELENVEDARQEACNIPELWKKDKWGKKVCTQKTTRDRVDYVCWDVNDFVNCLLGTMGKQEDNKPRIRYFSKDRIHTFTFCSLDDPNDVLKEENVVPDIIRLSRSVVDSYLLPFDLMVQQGAILKTYENIFFSSATEGTTMFCIAKPENESFIKNIHNTFNRQYLIIYILVLLQRYTLLSLERMMVKIERKKEEPVTTYSDKKSNDELWNLIDIICRIKVNCYYTDVSIYSHHSQFYQHCCKNLHVPETFAEINDKIDLLKMTTDRRIKELMEEEQQYMKKEQQEAERRHQILSIVVAILTIVQVMQAAYELIKPDEKDAFALWFSIGVGVVAFLLFLYLMWKDLLDFYSNIKNNH